jgi:hypothetical protein
MSMATTCTASRQSCGAPTASTRCHGRCGPRPGGACPGRRPCHKASVPPVRELHVFPAVGVLAPAGPAAAVLVDAQVSHRGGLLLQDLVRSRGERGRPGDAGVPGRRGRGDPAVRDLGPGLAQEPTGDRAAQRDLRHPLGERARGQSPSGHSSRRSTRNRSMTRPDARTSRGRARPTSRTLSENVPHHGHAAGTATSAHTISRPSAPRSASVTRTPSIPVVPCPYPGQARVRRF